METGIGSLATIGLAWFAMYDANFYDHNEQRVKLILVYFSIKLTKHTTKRLIISFIILDYLFIKNVY
jgi:hypothetical protein